MMAKNLGSTVQKAKKPHRCDNCGRRIEVGQPYLRARIVDGGEAWVWKSHSHCQLASTILFDRGIEGEDGMLPLVCNMDMEDRRMVRDIDPECATAIWGQV